MRISFLVLACAACSSSPSVSGDAGTDAASQSDVAANDAQTDAPSVNDAVTDGAASTCGKPEPDATNTGVPPGTTLTPSGSLTVSTKGQIVENLFVTGSITVLADDVVIRNVHIKSSDYYPIRYFDNDNTGLLVEDSEIEGTSGDVTSCISFANYTARRLNIHGSADGFKADSNVLIEDCWVHDLSNGPGEHNDCVQSTGGKGVTIRHNTMNGGSNSAVQTGDESGSATEDMTIDCNWLDNGGYTLNIRGAGATAPKGTVITSNRFGHGAQYGPWTLDDPNPTVTGNVWDDTNQPIPYP